MNIEKLIYAAKLARGDLFYVMHYPDSALTFGKFRLEQSIRLITEALNDENEFNVLKEKWEKES